MAQEIFIDIDEQGNVKIEAAGFEGSDCKALTEGIEKALGEVTSVKKKPEYHRTRAATRTTKA
jgi:uncharacterized protein YuzE